MLKERLVSYKTKSRSGVEYTKYKKVLVDLEKEKLYNILNNKLTK